MIGTLSVKIAAHNPSFPLEPVFTFVNSAQSFRIMNVPRKIGRWDINKVFVNLEYPDTTTVRKECVLNGSVWVGTVDGCATSGTSTNGFIVTASGIDEDGNAVSNYVLGAGDLYVQKLDGSIAPDQNAAKMFFYEETPTTPKEGDTTFIHGMLNIWDGTAWRPVAQVPTKTSDLTNDSGFITSADVPTPSYIEDANGNKIEADGDYIKIIPVQEDTVWHFSATYSPSSASISGDATYDSENHYWSYTDYYGISIKIYAVEVEGAIEGWRVIGSFSILSPEGGSILKQFDFQLAGDKYTQSLHYDDNYGFIIDLTRDAITTGKLAKESDIPTKTSDLVNDSGFVTSTELENGVEKLVEDANDEHSTRVVVDEYDNVLVQKYTTGWYVSKIEVSIGTTTDFTETNEYYAYLTDVRLDTEEGLLYFTTVAQDKQRNLNLYKLSGHTTNYSTGEFITTSFWTATQTGGQAIYLHLTVTNAETPVWVNIARLVPDSSKYSGLLDTQITPNGQFVTPTQVKPFNYMLGYARRAQGSLFLFGRSDMLTPDENHFVTIDYNVGKLCYVGQTQYPWQLSMYNGTTFDPPIQMNYGYWGNVAIKVNGRIRNFAINRDCWLGIIKVDSRNTRPCYIMGIENENGSIVADNNFYYYGASYPITFSASKLSIETIDGVEGGITCTRQGTGTHQTELKYVAYEDSVPTKTSDLTNDSGFITAKDIIIKRDVTDFRVRGKPQGAGSTFVVRNTIPSSFAETLTWSQVGGDWTTGGYYVIRKSATTSGAYILNYDGEDIGEFSLDANGTATVTHNGVVHEITGYIGNLVTNSELPTKTSDLTNDSGFVMSSDPYVGGWRVVLQTPLDTGGTYIEFVGKVISDDLHRSTLLVGSVCETDVPELSNYLNMQFNLWIMRSVSAIVDGATLTNSTGGHLLEFADLYFFANGNYPRDYMRTSFTTAQFHRR